MTTMSMAGRIRRSLKLHRQLRFTRQGKWFTAMTIMVGLGAINTGNNLLYLMLGMMLGLILVSGMMSEATLKKLHPERLAVGPVFAGEEARPEYRMSNTKRLYPSFSIELGEIPHSKDSAEARSARTVPGWRSRPPLPGDVPHAPRCHFLVVPAGGSRVARGRVTLNRRGLHRYEALEIRTRFPFGFFEKFQRFPRDLFLLAYPRRVDPPSQASLGIRPLGDVTQPRAGRGMEYYSLKEYQVGEDWRNIHWKVTARRDVLVVREHEQERTQSVTLAVYNLLRPGHDAQAQEAMERAIEVAAAVARSYLARAYTVDLHTLGGQVGPGTGPGQLSRILTALALVEVLLAEEPRALPTIGMSSPVILLAPAIGGPGLPPNRFDQILLVGTDGAVQERR